jgi:uncharacterized protein (DUF849 family)
MVQACVNGARIRGRDHPDVPITAEQIAGDAMACREAGATAVHVHVRDARGFESMSDDHVSPAVESIRKAVGGMPIGLTTGAWIVAHPERRCEAISSWRWLPDFASVNWHEEGADQVAAALLDREIGVEAGLWGQRSVELWARSPVAGRCERVLLELPAGLSIPGLRRASKRMLRRVRQHDQSISVQLHGAEDTTWPAIDLAREWGLDTRVGLEDTLLMPDGSLAEGNAALVRTAVARSRTVEC